MGKWFAFGETISEDIDNEMARSIATFYGADAKENARLVADLFNAQQQIEEAFEQYRQMMEALSERMEPIIEAMKRMAEAWAKAFQPFMEAMQRWWDAYRRECLYLKLLDLHFPDWLARFTSRHWPARWLPEPD